LVMLFPRTYVHDADLEANRSEVQRAPEEPPACARRAQAGSGVANGVHIVYLS
jgi:hypothetical protein